MNKVIFY